MCLQGTLVLRYCFFSAEFTREVTDTQMPLVAPVILPEMYKIFTMAEVRSRSSAGALLCLLLHRRADKDLSLD